MKKYIVKYAGEISTKQSRTRWRMINQLYSNIIKALKYHNIKLNKGKATWDFIYVELEEKALEVLRYIPGIQYLAEVEVIHELEKEKILEKGLELFKDKVDGKRFAVRCRNRLTQNKTYRSMDIEVELGSLLYDYAAGVKLTNPDITCRVEIKEEGAFFYSEKINGIIGFPTGNTGKGIMLLSGGIDSPVAAYSMIRMGMTPVFVYFDLGGAEQKKLTIKAFKYLYEKYLPGQNIDYISIPFEKTIEYIRTLPQKYQNLLLKYFFYKVSEKLAFKYRAKAIVTGEALGQVSTQTVDNIIMLDKYSSYSVFRPTLFMPKLEIISLAEQIGTMDFAYTGKEYCAIATKRVATSGRKDIFDKIIEIIPLEEKLKDILGSMVVYTIDTIDKAEEITSLTEVDFNEYVLINLGSKKIADDELRTNLNSAIALFKSWDKSKVYKIVCDEGIQSGILTEAMRKAGFNVIV